MHTRICISLPHHGRQPTHSMSLIARLPQGERTTHPAANLVRNRPICGFCLGDKPHVASLRLVSGLPSTSLRPRDCWELRRLVALSRGHFALPRSPRPLYLLGATFRGDGMPISVQMQKLEGRFSLAERRVATGARLPKRQVELVARRRKAGRDAAQATKLLDTFEDLHLLFVHEREEALVSLLVFRFKFRLLN